MYPGALLGCQGMGEFQNMLHAALNIGVDPVAIKETIYQATAYLEIGRTCDFLIAANGIMEQHGVRLPLAPQASTNEETRFERGLAKQVELFGPDMAKRQTDGRRFAETLTAGWRTTALETIIPATA